MTKRQSALVLVALLAINVAVAALGSIATITQVDGWYADAEKAFWSPPNGLFGPAWTVLYTLMAVAAWLVWRESNRDGSPISRADVRRALTLYVIQLVLNAVWTPVFFGLYPLIGVSALWLALAIIVAMDVLVLLTMIAFWRVRRAAAVLLIPYWAWILFATTLNVAVAVLQS
jgi:tryptophan-rich sensory protein